VAGGAFRHAAVVADRPRQAGVTMATPTEALVVRLPTAWRQLANARERDGQSTSATAAAAASQATRHAARAGAETVAQRGRETARRRGHERD